MKKVYTVLLALCIAGIVCGCSAKTDVDKTSVIIDKKGAVTQVIVEDFSQPYYNQEELKSQIEQKAAQYNQSCGNQEGAVLDELDVSEQGQIKVRMKFAGSQDYTSFNEKLLFVGTVSDAYSAGYSFPDMTAVSDGGRLAASEVLEKGGMHIAVLEESQQLKLPGKIAYYSEGVSLIDDKTAINLNEGQTAFVIYE